MNQQIDPWGQVNIKNYENLCKDFGIEEFSKILHKIPDPTLAMRRGVIFGHKDFELVLQAIKEKKDFIMMTGLMPSGTFHFGHKTVVDQMIYYQEKGAECFITVADIEAYLTRDITLEKAREIAINEYLTNYIALGLKPKKMNFYFQSNWKKEYNNLSKFISKRTTFNEIKSIYGDTNPAKITSALIQVADILHPQLKEFGGPRPTVVPVGADQLPHINFTRDIATRARSEFNFIRPSATFNILIPGLRGGKMSSSITESYIAFTDTPETVAKKIRKYAFSGGQATIEEHRKKGGDPNIDVSYQWLRMLFEPDDKKLEKIYNEYKSGKLLTGELKEILIEKVNSFLKEHQRKREQAKKHIDKFILQE
ncbi:tryptophan--tRNA ligase [Candidatus Woesearchaeota archaeon]|nr:tryptophan--tRNA ligase [Candidatus Woesearchaeota archaeon]